ncbi:nuclear transport factor 2 family protein [Streptomyces sp. NPDC090075]|uniref:nuclear transport factor 2 family protein n=1 Tax=Streptomyces sp. NPDC090075 TaxID=3365937 RepID=UPI0037FC605E
MGIPSDDYQDLVSLKARYFLYLDTKQWPQLAELFAPDATIGTFGDSGPAAFVQLLAERLAGITCVHQGFTPRFEQVSAVEVHGVWAMQEVLYWDPATHSHSPTDLPGQFGVRGYGHYHDTYRRTADGWRIKSQSLQRLVDEPLIASGAFGPASLRIAGVAPEPGRAKA